MGGNERENSLILVSVNELGVNFGVGRMAKLCSLCING